MTVRMSTVLLAHSESRTREGLATSLGSMGFKVVSVPDIETALDVAGQETSSLLVEPALLAGEEFEVQTRLDLRAGHPVRILALTHRAQPAEMAILRRHGAGLLARPIEDLERLATMLRIHASESAPAPWEPVKRAAPPVAEGVRERASAPLAAAAAPAPSVPPPWATMPPLPAPTANPWVSPVDPPKADPTKVVPVGPPVVAARPVAAESPRTTTSGRSPWAEDGEDEPPPPAPAAPTKTRVSRPEGERPFTFADEEGEATREIVTGFRPGLAPEATPAWPAPPVVSERTPAVSSPPPSSLDPFEDMGTVVSRGDAAYDAPEFTTEGSQTVSGAFEPTIPDEPTVAGEGALAGDSAGIEREPTPLDTGLIGPVILVVEDDPTFRQFLRELLTQQGYRVHTAINASNALRLLKTGEPVDLVISDLNMPHMDGFELKHEIDQWLNRSMPFIVCTADPTEDKIHTAAQVGAAALVPKPIDDLDAFYAIVLDTLRDAKIVG